MPARNLPHECETQSRATGITADVAIKRFEHALALRLGHAGAMVAHCNFHNAFARADFHRDGWRTVAVCIFEQVADQPPQQARIAF